jgi:hypothetical protein
LLLCESLEINSRIYLYKVRANEKYHQLNVIIGLSREYICRRRDCRIF